MGFSINDPNISAFTAIIQVGAVVATLLFLRKSIFRIGGASARVFLAPANGTQWF